MKVTKELSKQLLMRLFYEGEIKIDDYYELEMHKKDPTAPLSPIFIDLRTPDNPRPGPMTFTTAVYIAEAFYKMTVDYNLQYDRVAGIPLAADILAEAFSHVASRDGREVPVLKLNKIQLLGQPKRYEIAKGQKYQKGEIILLLDDVFTKAETKFYALKAFDEVGLVVKDIMAVIDREQGGVQTVEEAGYNVYVWSKLTGLLDFYLKKELISLPKYDEIISYIKNN